MAIILGLNCFNYYIFTFLCITFLFVVISYISFDKVKTYANDFLQVFITVENYSNGYFYANLAEQAVWLEVYFTIQQALTFSVLWIVFLYYLCTTAAIMHIELNPRPHMTPFEKLEDLSGTKLLKEIGRGQSLGARLAQAKRL